MKQRLLFWLCGVLCGIGVGGFATGWIIQNDSEYILEQWREAVDPSFEDLLDEIEWVESRGDPNAAGDGGEAIGAYQLTEIYVDDVNRILIGWKEQIGQQIKEAGGKGLGGWFVPYTYKDRWNRNHSRDMARVYLTYYNPSDAENEFEAMARIHNGGPDGWKKESTKEYWEKVESRLERKEL